MKYITCIYCTWKCLVDYLINLQINYVLLFFRSLFTNQSIEVHIGSHHFQSRVGRRGSRNLRTKGRGPGAVKFLRPEDYFDAPSHIPYAFVVKVEN